MSRNLTRKGLFITSPKNIDKLTRSIDKHKQAILIYEMLLSGVSVPAIARELEIDVQKLQLYFSEDLRSYELIDKQDIKWFNVTLHNLFPDNIYHEVFGRGFDADSVAYKEQKVDMALSIFGERSKRIMYLRYAQQYTLEDIANEYGLTRARVGQIILGVKNKLQSYKGQQLLLHGKVLVSEGDY